MALDLVEAVLASGATLPSPGLALPRLQAVAADDNAGLRDYAQAVASDPAVCGALMRVANSPVFRPPSQSKTVEQAVSVLGLARTLAVTASVTLKSQSDALPAAVRPAVMAVFEVATRLADLSFVAARASRQRRLGDSAYLAALMQDSGLIILARREMAITPPYGGLNDGHPALGAALLRNWKLPAEIVAAVAMHHAPADAARTRGDAADLAVLLAAGRYLHDGDEALWEPWQTLAESELGLTAAALGEIRVNLPA